MKLISSFTKVLFLTSFLFFTGSIFAESGHGDESEHEEEGHIELSNEQIQHAGIVVSTVGANVIRDVLPVYGLVATNAESLQVVNARFDGVVRDVKKSIGDPVRKGETLLIVEANESLKNYPITSEINGYITQRNINIGEKTNETPLLVIQDFSTVWVELSIFPKDLPLVKLNQTVNIQSTDLKNISEGKIIYISPFGQVQSQATKARVLLENSNNIWKPGLFVNANITLDEINAPVSIRNEAIQVIEDKNVVFVKGESGFEPREVSLGRTDGQYSEVLTGLSVGEMYVSNNSFVLKSELGKEDAEHGH